MLIEKVNKPLITGKNISKFSLFLGTELGVGGWGWLEQPTCLSSSLLPVALTGSTFITDPN